MIVSSDPDYIDTKLIKQGSKQLDQPLQELADWIFETYGTRPLNIYYDVIETDRNRPRLNIVFEYQYNFADFFVDGQARVMKNGNLIMIDKKGKEVKENEQ